MSGLPAWPLGPAETLWCAAALFAGYAVRGAAGFGSGVVATPLLVFAMPLSTAAPLITFIGAFVSVRQALRDWRLIEWRRIADFVPGILLGVPLGIWLFKAVSPTVLIRSLGAYVVLYALYSLLGGRFAWRERRFPRWTAVPIGTAGAALATVFGGMAGPVYVTYLDGLRLPMRVFRVTVSTTLLALNIARSGAYLVSGVFHIDDFTLVVGSVLPVLLGTWAGEWVHDRISPEAFRRGVAALLIASGAALLLR
ncbi:MAG TPA: sulfite exporter TauE/SafE family protein [Casimicrobiaceae bacterium]|nr:sulfite exporter TauE/SafE family protein [Casimicrobiaceae bacterium]